MTAMPYRRTDDELELRLGYNVRRRRVRLGLTQHQLGDAVGLPQSAISEIESGRSWVSWPTLQRLGEVLDASPGALLRRARRQQVA